MYVKYESILSIENGNKYSNSYNIFERLTTEDQSNWREFHLDTLKTSAGNESQQHIISTVEGQVEF